MTTLALTRTITCTVQGMTTKNGRNGDYLVLEVLRPKMKFPEKYNAWEPAAFEGVNSGDTINLMLEREKVKDDKSDDGQVTSYWWRAVAPGKPTSGTMPEPTRMEQGADPDWDAMGDPRAQEPAREPVDDLDTKILKGQAFNAAYTLIAATLNVEGGVTPVFTQDIRELRDRLYHEVLEKSVAPAHYCYEHETARTPTRGGTYVHPFTDGDQQVFCTEGGLVDGTRTPAIPSPDAETQKAE